MPHHYINLPDAETFAREDRVLNQSAAARAMQHFREIRFQPRAFARSQNHDGKILIRHRDEFSLGSRTFAMSAARSMTQVPRLAQSATRARFGDSVIRI